MLAKLLTNKGDKQGIAKKIKGIKTKTNKE
jgi:hypothetical protein